MGLLVLFSSVAQVKEAPAFEVVGRKSLTGDKAGRLGISAKNNNVASYSVEQKENRTVYNIQNNGVPVAIDALSNIEYAKNADRIVVYGDSLYKHVVTNAYVRMYSGSGSLIKSLGLVAVAPFVAAVTDNGSFIIAGNSGRDKGKPVLFLSFYDQNGNKLWQTDLPAVAPINVYSSHDNQYIAVTLYNPETISNSIRYYNASGKLLFTDNTLSGISAVEFLPSGKAVVCTSTIWYLYDLSNGYKLLHSGVLPGNTLGKYPVSAHPSRDIFFIVTTSESAKSGYVIRAYDGAKGALLAESFFEGKSYWQPYRLAEVDQNGTIQVITEKEILTLRMK